MKKAAALLISILFMLSACQTANNDYIQQVKPPSDPTPTPTVTVAPTPTPSTTATAQAAAAADEKITLIVTMPTTFNRYSDDSWTLQDEKAKMQSLSKPNVTLTINHYELDKIDAQLQTAFMSGDAYSVTGDIFLAMQPNIQYARRGYFADLYELMDNDNDGNREDYYINVLKATEYNEKLPYIPINFSINYLAANKKLDAKDLDAFAAMDRVSNYDMIQFYNQVSDKKGLLIENSFIPSFYHILDELSGFVDYESQSSSFNNEGVISLLRAFKESYVMEAKSVDDALAGYFYGSFYYNNDYEASQKSMFLLSPLHPLQFILPYENVNYTHLIPMTDVQGNINARFGEIHGDGSMHGFYSILETSPNKAIAWDYIQNALSEDALLSKDKKGTPHPTSTYLINRIADQGNFRLYIVPSYFDMSKEHSNITLEGKTSEHRDTALAYFNEVLEMPIASMYAAYDTNITDVVLSEFDLYLNDVQTAEQTAANIHNKVQLYLME